MRITKKTLQVQVDYLNKLTNKEWFLSQQLGGFAVTRIVTAGGGESHLFRHSGHMPARELLERLTSYIQGIEDERAQRWLVSENYFTHFKAITKNNYTLERQDGLWRLVNEDLSCVLTVKDFDMETILDAFLAGYESR
jgi:hypothetical protein